MRQIRAHGQSARYHHVRIGLNGRLDTLQAAILLAKLSVFEDELQSRERIAERYGRQLTHAVRTPQVLAGNSSVYAQYTIEVDNRQVIQQTLHAASVPTAGHYPIPLHLQPAFEYLAQGPGSFPHSELAARRVLSLPMHAYLSERDQDKVCAALVTAVESCVVGVSGK
jgi:UDP-2-acetamido-2-deoxy-ribo-hexuluronate aminotransferase